MIPEFLIDGNLPPGIYGATWAEIEKRFGSTSHRRRLLGGLLAAMLALKGAGCETIFLDGSFVTSKVVPSDYDACWDIQGVDPTLLDPVFLLFDNGRAAQKAKFLGEFFPAQMREGNSQSIFLDFFQIDKQTGNPKGIIAVDLRVISK